MSGHHSFERLRAHMSPDRKKANRDAADDMNREYVLAGDMTFSNVEDAISYLHANV